MSKPHRHYTISKVYPGMILADELLDKRGYLLLPAGTVLTTEIIHAMSAHEVHQLSILTTPGFDDEIKEQAERQKKIDRLAILFRHPPSTEAGASLMAYISKYRTGGAP